jgi:hypothetical protein
MNDYQKAKQTSHQLIVIEARQYPNVVSLIPTFATGIDRLETISNQIDVLRVQQSRNITGVTDDKNAVMEDVIDYMIELSGAVHSYAVSTNNQTLKAKVNYKESTIERMSQPDLITAAAIVIEEADKIGPALANEGISTTDLNEFRTAFDKFKETSSEPREAIIDRTGYTQQLADLFSEASDLKKNTLDRLAIQFKRKAPEFYAKYKSASMVIYKRRSKTSTTEKAKA